MENNYKTIEQALNCKIEIIDGVYWLKTDFNNKNEAINSKITKEKLDWLQDQINKLKVIDTITIDGKSINLYEPVKLQYNIEV
jgi:hypothetical protein